MIALGNFKVGPIAQSVEQRTFNPWVDGSSPSGPTFSHELEIKRIFLVSLEIVPPDDYIIVRSCEWVLLKDFKSR